MSNISISGSVERPEVPMIAPKVETDDESVLADSPYAPRLKRAFSSADSARNSKRTKDEENSPSCSGHAAGHRPVTSCTHCRQHKIKCNASERFPVPCSRCERMDLKCEIDPQFRPKKGSQLQSLRNDVDELRKKIEFLTKNESLISNVLQSSNPDLLQQLKEKKPIQNFQTSQAAPVVEQNQGPPRPAVTELNPLPVSQTNSVKSNGSVSEFILGDVKIPHEKAKELHQRFIVHYLPYLPIMISNDCVQLYQQSQLLFWTVMLTACLSDPEPSLYISLASLIKQLAIETCWIKTPRSTHIVQALLILGTWPLPNQKVLDDCSYRFVGLAKSLSLQLGLHRGKFISEFSRTQVALPDAEKWRTRTWLAVFFADQFWASNLGLPSSMQTDFLLEQARIDQSLPKNFRCLISLAIFQAKLVNVMGSSVTSPDGLMDPRNRAGALAILERELERLAYKLQINDIVVESYYLYVQLMVCCFAFLPETPSEDQTKYVTQAYLSATRIVTIVSKLTESRQLTEYPIYVRQSVSMAAFVLFRLHLTPYLLPKYIDSARQSIVTVHRLFRNMLAAWKDVENDISRTATVLEKLNFVIITHPELFTETDGIIARMRSHLTGSLFYDLVWCIHEARRRLIAEQNSPVKDSKPKSSRKVLPLPFYNQITKDDFRAITTTTPNGTTVTTLVPTHQAISNARANASAAGLSDPTEINGIPLAMLEATGSLPGKNKHAGNGTQSDSMDPPKVQPHNKMATKSRKKSKSTNAVTVSARPIAPAPPRTQSGTPLPMEQSLFGPPIDASMMTQIPQQLTSQTPSASNSRSNSNEQSPNSDALNNNLFIDSIFQQQGGANWMDNTDDFLGWFDINMAPEF
ncbi:hypothetical protein KL930_001365 [Ogataea haglerorum]|uniref:Zn(2)-C6 fungal-type domain-containing protein n=1 Tax=Ogataea haglerorum TaxID=1937702 RepID=A0ABQ7RG95_9ASCO|nr:uncharacterized protein KL911_003766 [Ogataea haglerorum]KAG7695042.1 hypothetical protein KL915_003275 [Ogataea haglerorum]KAG7698587.1 hypothetical protein KL951_001851 [Ogataea haglerorum]KAG7706366.1 hypothetical protein KL914_003261 [Ogataea haglerorum]KAG7717282.1 hypothetical protein KL913_003033 [Ogataea haglerorum]KAG7719330.1 hypothetical protein KL949_002322 [Ogataea haglerorum]